MSIYFFSNFFAQKKCPKNGNDFGSFGNDFGSFGNDFGSFGNDFGTNLKITCSYNTSTMNLDVTEINNKHHPTNQCTICNKTYKTISGLWKHSKNCNASKNTASKSSKCVCGKEYLNRSSLWRHKQKCDINNASKLNSNVEIITQYGEEQVNSDPQQIINKFLMQAISDMMKQNKEFQTQLLEIKASFCAHDK